MLPGFGHLFNPRGARTASANRSDNGRSLAREHNNSKKMICNEFTRAFGRCNSAATTAGDVSVRGLIAGLAAGVVVGAGGGIAVGRRTGR
jgi:hypothetical protein